MGDVIPFRGRASFAAAVAASKPAPASDPVIGYHDFMSLLHSDAVLFIRDDTGSQNLPFMLIDRDSDKARGKPDRMEWHLDNDDYIYYELCKEGRYLINYNLDTGQNEIAMRYDAQSFAPRIRAARTEYIKGRTTENSFIANPW